MSAEPSLETTFSLVDSDCTHYLQSASFPQDDIPLSIGLNSFSVTTLDSREGVLKFSNIQDISYVDHLCQSWMLQICPSLMVFGWNQSFLDYYHPDSCASQESQHPQLSVKFAVVNFPSLILWLCWTLLLLFLCSPHALFAFSVSLHCAVVFHDYQHKSLEISWFQLSSLLWLWSLYYSQNRIKTNGEWNWKIGVSQDNRWIFFVYILVQWRNKSCFLHNECISLSFYALYLCVISLLFSCSIPLSCFSFQIICFLPCHI